VSAAVSRLVMGPGRGSAVLRRPPAPCRASIWVPAARTKRRGCPCGTPPSGFTASLRPSSCQRPSSRSSSPFLLLERWLLSVAHRYRVV